MWFGTFIVCIICIISIANAQLNFTRSSYILEREWSNVDPGLRRNRSLCVVQGWVSGPQYQGPSLQVELFVDDTFVMNGTANVSRSLAGPHGFELAFECDLIATGLHYVHVRAPPISNNMETELDSWTDLKNSPLCTYDAEYWPSCTTPPPGPAPPPGQICSADQTEKQTHDCNGVEGRYTCTAQSWTVDAVIGQGQFGFCQKSVNPNSTAMRCCRLHDPNHQDKPPAPPIIAPSYPLPPSVRPNSSGPLPNVIFFLTDDQDVKLESLSVMNHTMALLRDGLSLNVKIFASSLQYDIYFFIHH